METELTKGVVLVSGGLDSTTLMYQFVAQNVEFVPLFINYGQHCANKEYGTLLKVVPEKYKDKNRNNRYIFNLQVFKVQIHSPC